LSEYRLIAERQDNHQAHGLFCGKLANELRLTIRNRFMHMMR